MNFDFRTFLSNHPALKSATEALADAVLKAAEDAALAAVGTVPVVGGILETLGTPIADSLEAKIDGLVRAAIERFLSGHAVSVAVPTAKMEVLSVDDRTPAQLASQLAARASNGAAPVLNLAESYGAAKQRARGQQIADDASALAALQAAEQGIPS